jgi:hypothetical protein
MAKGEGLKKLFLLIAFALMLALPYRARAQSVPTPMQGSAALEGSHIFSNSQLFTIQVTWHTAAARWLMLFDAAAVPSNGTVAPLYCAYLQNASSQADGTVSFDFTLHPIPFRTGTVAVVSTSATGCGSLTADGANDWLWAQVR